MCLNEHRKAGGDGGSLRACAWVAEGARSIPYLPSGPPGLCARPCRRRGRPQDSGRSDRTSCCPPSSDGRWALPGCRSGPSAQSTPRSPANQNTVARLLLAREALPFTYIYSRSKSHCERAQCTLLSVDSMYMCTHEAENFRSQQFKGFLTTRATRNSSGSQLGV